MPKLTDRLRQLLDLERSGDGQEPAEASPRPVPPARPVVVRTTGQTRQQEAPEPVGPAEGLTVAQEQELLGPCQGCDGYWTREVKRGQKPQTCPVCKRDGPPDA